MFQLSSVLMFILFTQKNFLLLILKFIDTLYHYQAPMLCVCVWDTTPLGIFPFFTLFLDSSRGAVTCCEYKTSARSVFKLGHSTHRHAKDKHANTLCHTYTSTDVLIYMHTFIDLHTSMQNTSHHINCWYEHIFSLFLRFCSFFLPIISV